MCIQEQKYLRYWLKSIRTFAAGAHFAVVGSFLDKFTQTLDGDKAKLKALLQVSKEIRNEIKEVFGNENKAIECKHLGKNMSFFPIDNTKSGHGERDPCVKLLGERVVSTLEKDAFVTKPIPMMWAKVSDELIASKEKIMRIEDVRKLAAKWWVTGSNFKKMLNKLHQLGIILYFDEEGMREFVVISPQYLLEK